MQYKRCVSCGLELPLSVLVPIQIKHQGQIVTVSLCEICRDKKIKESKKEI